MWRVDHRSFHPPSCWQILARTLPQMRCVPQSFRWTCLLFPERRTALLQKWLYKVSLNWTLFEISIRRWEFFNTSLQKILSLPVTARLKTVQDFIYELGMKPHLVDVIIFHYIMLAKVINNLLNRIILIFKVFFQCWKSLESSNDFQLFWKFWFLNNL